MAEIVRLHEARGSGATGSVYFGFLMGQIMETDVCEGTIASAGAMTPTDNGVQLNVSSLSDRYPAGLPP